MNNETLPLSPLEQRRLKQVVSAVDRGEWQEFKALSDVPFPDDDVMKEQFLESREAMESFSGEWTLDAVVKIDEDGSRFIFGKVMPKNDNILPITVTLQSTGDGDASRIWVLVFIPELDLNNL